jgi:spore maturation protein CgeB
MKILYHFPNVQSVYAYRTIYNGFKNAFLDLGHDFRVLTASDDLVATLDDFEPDIFITASHFLYRKYVDYSLLKTYRDKGLVVFTKIDYWNAPSSAKRLSEAKGMKDDAEVLSLIKDNLLGDVYFSVVEQEDKRMEGFKEVTGHEYYTIPLAADKTVLKHIFDQKFVSDVSYIGTYLPAKKKSFDELVFPLRNKYKLSLYGQDWTLFDRGRGWVGRFGQLFNIPFLRSVQKPKLQLDDEAKIYSSSIVSINIHEEHQHEFGGDCNERTFKIPLCGGFEIVDEVACIHKYFEVGKEIIVAKNKKDWYEKIDYYIKNPDARLSIIQAGMERVLKDHTYNNRAIHIIKLAEDFVKTK